MTGLFCLVLVTSWPFTPVVKVSSTFSPFGSLGSSVVTTAGFGSGTSGISGTVILSGTFDLSGVFGLSSGFFSGFDISNVGLSLIKGSPFLCSYGSTKMITGF